METLRFPGNADGIEEAHDVLAAEEFAMPAHADVGPHTTKSGATSTFLVIVGAAALAVVVYAALRRR
jgi:hypothetical protein